MQPASPLATYIFFVSVKMLFPAEISHISTIKKIADSSPLSKWVHKELTCFLGYGNK
jgi:hypothetical protein